jgi:ribosome-binding factor A
MSRTHHSGTTQSQRMLRVAELVRHALAQLLARGAVDDPILTKQTGSVAAVRMSPDLRLATIYVVPRQGSEDVTAVIAAFERHRKFLRGEIARHINLKFAPEIRFRADASLAESARIDALLLDPAVQRDLTKKANHGDES